MKRKPKEYEATFERAHFYEYLETKELQKVFSTSIVELDNMSQSAAVKNHNTYLKAFKILKYVAKQSRGYQKVQKGQNGVSEVLPMVKKIYLRTLVNLTETFKLKFNENDKYFNRFKEMWQNR